LKIGTPFGHRQGDEGVEAEGDLRTGRMLAAVDAAAEPGQVGQRIGETDAAQA
jgi:hypothetical protein